MRAAELAKRIGAGWPSVLERLGIPRAALTGKHGPCPACGGKDRFRYTNYLGRGGYICSQCGAGDGFTLLMKVHRWDFRTAMREVAGAAGVRSSIETTVPPTARSASQLPTQAAEVAKVAIPSRVLRLRRESCAVADCADAVEYLASRRLWPLPDGCTLRAHPSAEYFQEGRRVGRYPALLSEVRDLAGELVTVHITYLQNGRKLTTFEPRKILSPLTDRAGCAVRLMAAKGNVIGIAEGIETSLAAAQLHGIPTWAALNTSLLSKFIPPADITTVIVFADRDVPGLEAAAKLMQNLQGAVRVEIRTPSAPAKDWNDVLMSGKEIA